MISHEEILKRYRELLAIRDNLKCINPCDDYCDREDDNTYGYECPNCKARRDVNFKIEDFESFLKITPEDRAVIIAGGDPTVSRS